MIGLALTYFGLAALFLFALTADRLAKLRVLSIIVIPALAFAVWQAAQPPTGWPAQATPPKSALFVAGFVREPNAIEHDPGEIDLLLQPVGAPRPRLYRLLYSRQLHEQVEAASQGRKRGERVGLRVVARRHGERGPKVRYVAYRLPAPQAPPKD